MTSQTVVPSRLPPMSRPLLVVVLCLWVGACVPAEESNDRVLRFDPEKTVMGLIQDRGVLRVGVPDHCAFASTAGGGEPEGFVVELARLVADSLGVKAEFTVADSVELMTMVHVPADDPEAETDADLVFPLFPITERLVQRATMADPYWVGHSRKLVDRAGRVFTEGPDVWLLDAACRDGDVAIDGPESSTVGYGAVVRTGASTFATLVSQVVNEADAEGDWTKLYERWLADYFVEPASDKVPIMSVEDAAALWPADLGAPPAGQPLTVWRTRAGPARNDQG
jgi:hypothetical protein